MKIRLRLERNIINCHFIGHCDAVFFSIIQSLIFYLLIRIIFVFFRNIITVQIIFINQYFTNVFIPIKITPAILSIYN